MAYIFMCNLLLLFFVFVVVVKLLFTQEFILGVGNFYQSFSLEVELNHCFLV